MVATGRIDDWATRFPSSLVPKVIQLVLDSWKTFKTKQTGEVKITQEFCSVLSRNQRLSKLPFIIDLEITLINENGLEQIGRLDLRVIHGLDTSVYFSFECKRLRVTFPTSGFDSLAREYVVDGMYRYFNGQYAQGLDKGGMLAYVMDGEINKAVEDVKVAIEKRRTILHMESNHTLSCSSISTSNRVKETLHFKSKDKFVIYHIFLSAVILSGN